MTGESFGRARRLGGAALAGVLALSASVVGAAPAASPTQALPAAWVGGESPFPQPIVSELPTRRGSTDGVLMFDHGQIDDDGTVDIAILRHDRSVPTTSVEIGLGQGDGTFSFDTSIEVPGAPANTVGGVVIGEFTGDTHADLAVATADAASIAIHPGLGNGQFLPPLTVPVTAPSTSDTTGPHLLRSADVDGDGHVDLVAGFSHGVTFVRADGAGGFDAPVTLDTSLNEVGDVNDLAVADLDGDLDGEIVVVGDEGLQVFSPTSTTTFEASTPIEDNSFSDGFTGVIAGDFDGDGDLDVVVASTDTHDAVGLFTGDGSGGLQRPPTDAWVPVQSGVWIGSNTNDHLAEDLDGDGHVDALFTSRTAILPVFGDGSGGLHPRAWLARSVEADLGTGSGQRIGPAVATDVDGDGTVDLVAAGGNSLFSSVNVLLSDPDADRSWLGTPVFAVGDDANDSLSMTLVEFTGDDHLDIVSIDADSGLKVAAGRGDGSFDPPYEAADGGGGVGVASFARRTPRQTEVQGSCYFGYLDRTGDFDGDGHADLVCHDVNPFVYFGDGNGDVDGAQAVLLGDIDDEFHLTTDVLPVDLDGDGRDELVVASTRSTAAASFNDDTAQIQILGYDDESDALEFVQRIDIGAPEQSNLDSTKGLVAGDFDGDGEIDLAIWHTPDGAATAQRVVIPGTAGTTFGSPVFDDTDLPHDWALASRTGDMNGDGVVDIVSVRAVPGGHALIVEPGLGDGTFDEIITSPTTATSQIHIGLVVADIDLDGNLDAVVDAERTVEIHLGDGSGGFAAPTHLSRDNFGVSVAVGDLDGDGAPDIVADTQFGAAVYLTRGDVTVSSADLSISGATFPAGAVRAGDSGTVEFTVTNTGTGPALGSWVDEVTVDTDQGPVVVGNITTTGPLQPGESYTATIDVVWPALSPGNRIVTATADARDDVTETNDDNTQTGTISVVVDVLPFDLNVTGTVAEDRSRVYRLDVDAPGAVLTTTVPDTVWTATALGDVPADDQLSPAPGTTILGPGTHYLHLGGRDGAGDGAAFELRLTRLDAGVQSVSPSEVGRGPVTVLIEGAGFEPGATVSLRRGGTEVPTTKLQRVSSTRLLATFELGEVELGSYDVVVVTAGIERTLDAALEVVPTRLGGFEVFVSVPSRVRLFRSSPVEVTVRNTGDQAVLAPIVRVSADRARLGRHADGAFRTRAIDFLAVADDGSPILEPGETASITARFDPDPGVNTDEDIRLTAQAYGVDNPTTWVWGGGIDRMRPDGVPDSVWELAAESVLDTVGPTAGSYALALHDIHADLAELGLATDRADRMLPRVVARALAAVPGADLAGSVGDADGPLVERDVILEDQIGAVVDATTTIDGHYAFHGVAPGTYDVRVRDAVPAPVGVTQLPAAAALDLVVGAPVTLSGRVVNGTTDGPGVANVPVTVQRVGREGAGLASAQTDASGRFTIADVPVGELRIVARAPGRLAAAVELTVTEPGSVTVDPLVVTTGLSVAGTVTDPDDANVESARVIARVPGDDITATALTGADGTYLVEGLPAGPIELTVVGEGLGQASTTIANLAADATNVDLQLTDAGAIVGTISSSSGGPLGGAVVLTDAVRGDEIRTDANGSFRIDGVPAGEGRIEVRAPGHVPTSFAVTIPPGADADAGELTVPTLGTLRVTVEGADGTLDGVPVTATLIGGLGGTIRTGDDGVAVLEDLVPGQYVVHAGTSAGPASTRAVVEVESGENSITLGADLTTVSGVLRTPGGAPVAGAEVAALVGGDPLLITTTDSTGRFELLVAPGNTIDLRALAADDAVALTRDLEIGSADVAVTLTLGEAALEVSVRGPGDDPVADAAVVLRLDDAGEVARLTTATDGTATFSDLPVGGWTVLVAADGLAPQVVTGSLSGLFDRLDIDLEAGRTMAGTVVDAAGPVDGALVGTVDPVTGENVLTTTDTDGSWSLNSLSPGAVTVRGFDGSSVGETVVDLTSASASDVDVALDGAEGAVNGTVTDTNDTPLAGRVVQLVRDGLPIGVTTTGSDGRYGFEGVPAGEWDLLVSLGGGPSEERPITVPASGSITEDVETADGIGWVLYATFDLAPPGNVTVFNASVVEPLGPTGFRARAAGSLRLPTGPAGRSGPAGSGVLPRLGSFSETIIGLPRPQKNQWAVENETAWRANQNRTDPIDWDCPPVVFSLEAELIRSEIEMNQAFYDLQSAYGGVQQVYTAGMGEALADGAYTGLKTWVTLSSMAGGGQATTATGNIGNTRFVINQADEAANALAGVGLPVIDLAASGFGSGGVSALDGGSTVVGISGGVAGLAGKTALSNGIGAIGTAYDWKKFTDNLSDINESQINALVSFSMTEDRYLAAVQRHQQLSKSFAVATGDCDPDPPEEESDDDDEGPDDEGGGGGGGGGGDDDQLDDEPVPPGPGEDGGPDGEGDGTSTGAASVDPNEIVGPAGVGDEGWIAAPAELGYEISFENLPTATAPAVIVTITTTLDTDTDWTTFELGDMGWGHVVIDVPTGRQEWTGRVALPNTSDVVDIEAGLDAGTGEVTWVLTTIDPTTGDIPDDIDAGLPPNNEFREGEGFVGYSVAPASTDTGTEITAQASIVFDENDPIVTNEWRNTIDDDRPVADLVALPAESLPSTLELTWTSTDGGSGATRYDLYAQVDGSRLFRYARGLTATSASVPVTAGRSYAFAVVATDAVGLREVTPGGPEVTTLVTTPPDDEPDGPDGPDGGGSGGGSGGGGSTDGPGGGGSGGDGSGPGFVSLSPARVFDSRPTGRVTAGSITEVRVAGTAGVPDDAGAVVLNATVVNAAAPGYATVFPCGITPPDASNLNFVTGQTVPNAVISKIGTNGSVCVFSDTDIDLLLDVNGAFPAGADFTSLSPARVFDSRPTGRVTAGSITEVRVAGTAGVPDDAGAVVLNATVVNAAAPGYATVFPCGITPPDASNLNFVTGQTVPNAVISKIGTNGSVCVFSDTDIDLLLDVNGAVG